MGDLKICSSSGKPPGTDYSDCWSGQLVDTCGLPYDYYSIMHYSLGSSVFTSSCLTLS